MATAKQEAANRANAQRSTGPKTEEGKANSRVNAYRHGMASEHPLVETTRSPLDQERKALWMKQFKVEDSFRESLVDMMVAARNQLEVCWAEQSVLEQNHALRAEKVWDLDRRDEAYEIAEQLHANPWRTARKLERTPHGINLLIDILVRLDGILHANGKLSSDQRELLLDALGVHPELRDGPTEIDPPLDVIDKIAWISGAISGEVDRLESYIADGLDEINDEAREMASQGSGAIFTAKSTLLQRYIRDAERRFYRAQRALNVLREPLTQAETTAPNDAKSTAQPKPKKALPPEALEDDDFAMEIEDRFVASIQREAEAVIAAQRVESAADLVVPSVVLDEAPSSRNQQQATKRHWSS